MNSSYALDYVNVCVFMTCLDRADGCLGASHGSIKRKAGSDGMMGGEDDDNHHVQKRICL